MNFCILQIFTPIYLVFVIKRHVPSTICQKKPDHFFTYCRTFDRQGQPDIQLYLLYQNKSRIEFPFVSRVFPNFSISVFNDVVINRNRHYQSTQVIIFLLFNFFRFVNTVLSDELQGSVHALSIVAKTPDEFEKMSQQKIDPSPSCRGGFGK